MPETQRLSLAKMRTGQSGIIISIEGGHGMSHRLNTLGIIPGKKITKISSMLMRGPITAEIDRTQVALGFGMADKILVQPANRN